MASMRLLTRQTISRMAPARRTFSINTALRSTSKTPPPPTHTRKTGQSDGTESVHPSDAPQSSASLKDPAEHKTGDEHPAKQPDPQQDSERSTGFNEVKGGVPGGKAGLGYRSDRQR